MDRQYKSCAADNTIYKDRRKLYFLAIASTRSTYNIPILYRYHPIQAMKTIKISLAKSRSMLIATATILLPLLTCNFADARSIKVGMVKYDGLVSGLCVSFSPGTKKPIVIIPFVASKSAPANARMNINGEEILLKQFNLQATKGGKSIARYKAKDISVTIKSTTIKEQEEPSYSSQTSDEISIKYKGQTKTINTQGKCIG
jgi:hypothetical protein